MRVHSVRLWFPSVMKITGMTLWLTASLQWGVFSDPKGSHFLWSWRKEKLLTMSPWPLSLSPSPFFIFLDRKSGLRCQAVSWGPGRANGGGGPHPELHSHGRVQHWGGHSVVLSWKRGTASQMMTQKTKDFRCCLPIITACFFSPDKQLGPD